MRTVMVENQFLLGDAMCSCEHPLFANKSSSADVLIVLVHQSHLRQTGVSVRKRATKCTTNLPAPFPRVGVTSAHNSLVPSCTLHPANVRRRSCK